MGWKPTEKVPTSFPGEHKTTQMGLSSAMDREALTSVISSPLLLLLTVPNRAREELSGYDDE